jgi:hypothetical protein
MKFSLPFGKKSKKEYFLALVFRNEKVNAVFFEEAEGRVSILSKSSSSLDSSIEEATFESLLASTDKAISQAEQSLPQPLEIVKTVYGVKGSWVEDNRIKKDYLSKLTKIGEELGLKPIGFLVIFEAIAFLLEQDEGAPVSAILAEVGDKYLSAALLKGGVIKEFKTAEIAGSKPEALENVLKHFTTADLLPQRIILLDGDEKENEEFEGHKWSSGLSFLHPPKVITLPPEFDARAVLHGTATQLGFEVLDEKITDVQNIKKVDPDGVGLEKDPDVKESISQTDNIKIVDDAVAHFGFVKEKDIATEPIAEITKEEAPQEILDEVTEEIPEEVKEEEGTKRPLPENAFAILKGGQAVFSGIPKLFGAIPIGSLFKLSSSNLKFLGIPFILIILLLIGSYFYFFSNGATVVLGIDSKPTDKTQDVTFSQESSDPTRGILASEFLSITQEGTVSTKATGKKETGTNAKGTVTVFNSSSTPQTLSSGSTIVSSNGLEFSLDKEIKVASASGDIFSGTTPGKTDVAVTAKKIGQDYNLPSNSKFSVGGNSSVAAKNDDAFSGGTKKDITVVSDEDIKKLEEELPKKLEPQAKEELLGKIGDDEVLLPDFVEKTLVKKTLSKKADEEASEVKLTGVVQYKGVSYKKSDSVEFAKEILKNEISDDETIDEKKLEVEVDDIDQDDEDVTAKITIKAYLVPKIEGKELAKQISGKSFREAQNILERDSQVSDVDIKLNFNLPFLPKRLPLSAENIKVTAKVND